MTLIFKNIQLKLTTTCIKCAVRSQKIVQNKNGQILNYFGKTQENKSLYRVLYKFIGQT